MREMAAMSLPVDDWQFWVVTLLCVGAAWWLLRDIIPIPYLTKRRRRRRGEKRAKLTISAKSGEHGDPSKQT